MMADPVETMETVSGAKALLRKTKEPALFCAWVIGLMIIGSLVWVLIRPALSEKLMESVNYSLSAQGEEQLLSHNIPCPFSAPSPQGLWFAYENSVNVVFVFTILHDGVMIPCGAKIDRDGKVMDIFLLSYHAQQIYDRLPQGIVMLYISRIEKALEGRSAK